MNQSHFQSQMNRLAETYGAMQYKRERIELIWREVKDFEDRWLEGVVDEFIGTCRQAPLLPEFREKSSIERERLYQIEKAKNRVESERAFNRLFDNEIIASICKTIGDRARGNVEDKVYADFVRGVRGLGQVKCGRCEDTGLIWQRDDKDYEWPYRCICQSSQGQPRKIPQLVLIRGGIA